MTNIGTTTNYVRNCSSWASSPVRVTQPWLKGYNGEMELGGHQRSTIFQYLWVDQDLKREMGF